MSDANLINDKICGKFLMLVCKSQLKLGFRDKTLADLERWGCNINAHEMHKIWGHAHLIKTISF